VNLSLGGVVKNEPITSKGYEALRRWLSAAKLHDHNPELPEPDHRLLLEGIPQGCIRQISDELGIQLARDDGQIERLRNARFFDPPGLAAVRLLLMGGGSLRFNTKGRGKEKQLDYLVLSGHFDKKDRESERYLSARRETRINDADRDLGKVTLLRIIANTPPGQSTKGPSDHHSYRRSEIYVRPRIGKSRSSVVGKSPRNARVEAIDIGVMHFLYNKESLSFSLSIEEYKNMLKEAFDLLDKIPLKASR
jgi:hypothetical protein